MKASQILKATSLVSFAMKVAREAGDIQLKYFRSDHLGVTAKLNEADIVTRADKESDKLITNAIKRKYPDHGLLAEESGESNLTADWTWVIDPLDGTTNYASGLPLFAVSIGIRHKDETVGGVVYIPVTGEMFTAVKGLGAFLNGRPLRVSLNDRMDRAVVSTGFPVDKNINPDNNLDNVARVLPKVRGLRRLGAAAVDMCYVAAGFLDAYWELNLHDWDVCAAALIVEEAGGRIHHFRADRNVSVLASSAALYDSIKPLIR